MPSPATGNDAGLADPLLPSGDGAGRAAGASSKDKNKNWVPADEEEVLAAEERGGEDGRPLLYRTFKVRGILLHPYRYVVGSRLLVRTSTRAQIYAGYRLLLKSFLPF